jgi:segregation and condensation protein A
MADHQTVPAPAPMENITPIELLVDLARKGEIDPWDLDLVAVADRYLSALDQREAASLPLSGRMILFACILVHLKAQELSRRYAEAMPPPPGAVDAMGGEWTPGDDDLVDTESTQTPFLVSAQEGLMLLARPRRPRRPVTLEDLVKALRSFEESAVKTKVEGVSAEAFITKAAHIDHVVADVERVRKLLSSYGRGHKVGFHELVVDGLRPASLFIALLHMAAGEEVALRQPDLYGDLTVTRKAS